MFMQRVQQFSKRIKKMQKQKRKAMLQQYYEIKRMFQLPLKIRLYFSTLQGLIDKNHNQEISKQQVVDSLLIRVFQKQSEEQKIQYLLEIMRMLQLYYQPSDEHHITAQENKNGTTINNIETSCSMQTFSFRLSNWVTSKFKLDKFKRTISIHNKKKNFSLYLKQYLIRKSKKNTFTIVFQAIHKEIPSDYQKISLQFRQEVYHVIYQQLFQIVAQSVKENLVLMEKQSSTEQAESHVKPIDTDKSFAFLTSEQITNYLAYKAQITQRLQVGGFSFKNIYHKASSQQQVKIDRSSKFDKIFKLQCLIKRPIEDIKSGFLAAINSKYKYKTQSNILQQFSKRYRAVYDKYLINNKIYEQICIKEETNSEKEEIYFSKGMENVLTGNTLQFMIAKVKPTQNPKVGRLIIVVSLILTKDINLEIAIAFLLQFRAMLDSQNATTVSPVKQQEYDEEQFFSIVEQPLQTNQDEFDSDQYKPENKEFHQFVSKQKFTFGHQCLKQYYQLHPQQLTPQLLQDKKLKEHFFKNVWGREKKGGLICINQAMNQEQRNVIKKIVANLGANFYKIVKSGNVINYSLPLGIFKKASHLQLIGNNLAYAPLFFDRFYQQQSVDVLQRFKYAILLNISVSNLGISLEKPFNPILGETLQCWVGGCPLYLQQISHHPPISSYFFEGRGYKIYGCIDPKMSIGLNSLSCWSQKPNHIQFEDGSKICLIFGKMVMSGFILGDRQFNYQDRTYLYDMKNHLFCTMHFGAKKKGIPKNEAADFVHGRIFKTTPQFLQKFTSKTSMYPQKKDIQAELSSFQGIWNQVINFDGKQYINFSTQLPYAMQKEQFPLPSNYSFRKDLSLYLNDEMDKAQQQKQVLEQIQRRDRKLRDKYRK